MECATKLGSFVVCRIVKEHCVPSSQGTERRSITPRMRIGMGRGSVNGELLLFGYANFFLAATKGRFSRENISACSS
jgi:hypothetical protein